MIETDKKTCYQLIRIFKGMTSQQIRNI